MNISNKGKVIIRSFIYLPLVIILAGIFWFKWEVRRYKHAVKRIVTSISLPDTATFRDYALFLDRQIKPGFSAQEVHEVIKGYSKIDTVNQWPSYFEIYRYDLPLINRLFKIPTEVVIVYDSSWSYEGLSFED